MSTSKLIHCEWNAFYFSEIAFIDFRSHEIKQCIVFFGTPGTVNEIFYLTNRFHFCMCLYSSRSQTKSFCAKNKKACDFLLFAHNDVFVIYYSTFHSYSFLFCVSQLAIGLEITEIS